MIDVAGLQAELDAYAEVGLFGGTAPDVSQFVAPDPIASVYDGTTVIWPAPSRCFAARSVSCGASSSECFALRSVSCGDAPHETLDAPLNHSDASAAGVGRGGGVAGIIVV